MIYAEITLINCGDVALAKRHIIEEGEIKTMTVKMAVNSGAYMMAINETILGQSVYHLISFFEIGFAIK